MTKRMPILLGALLYLKAVLDNENIFCKMDIFLKKRKKERKKINMLGGRREVGGTFFRFVFQNRI